MIHFQRFHLNNLTQEDAVSSNPTLGGKILYSSFVKKVNKRNKTEERAVIITEKGIFKLDPKKNFKLMNDGIPLGKVVLCATCPATADGTAF